MQLQDSFLINPLRKKICFASLSVFILLILAYANSFEASWHFDDYPNIVANPNLHITDLSFNSIKQGLYGKNGDSLSRPLSMLSFALNYYFDEYNVWGYHLVNFSIHYLNAIGLFLFIYFTLNLPRQRDHYGQIAYPVALISAIFWATNPVQVTAVTYIVQRMTSLAGFGCIYSMLFYLLARRHESQRKYLYYGISAAMALLAFASKENSFMLPISILLFDLFLISGITKQNTLRILIFTALAGVVIIAASTVYTNPLHIINGYETRPFSLGERLLTEPRIIIFYLSLLFYPTANRLTLLHDVELSTSLFAPASTFWAITFLILIICYAIITAKRKPLISYCLIFFFINHLIEGTIIPLELIYEHRNYLPSMLIFLPIAILWIRTINYFAYSRTLQSCFCVGLMVILISQSNTTAMQNGIFRNELTLWQDSIKKTPDLQRTIINLGTTYSKTGQSEKAIKYLEQAKTSSHITNKLPLKRRQLINTNIGAAYYDLDNLKEAKKNFNLNIDKNGDGPARNFALMALVLLRENRLIKAEELIKKALKQHPSDPPISVIYSEILFKKGLTKRAIKEAKYALKLDKTRGHALLIIGLSLRIEGRYKDAIRYLKKFSAKNPINLNGHLALIEASQMSRDFSLRDKYVAEMVGLTNPNILKKSLKRFCSYFESEYYSPMENIQLAFTEVLERYTQNVKDTAVDFNSKEPELISQ